MDEPVWPVLRAALLSPGPWLALAVLAVVAGAAGVRGVWRARWRRAVAGGFWLAVVPPRQVEVAPEAVWRLLVPLLRRAAGGRWRLVRPPAALEIHARGGRLAVGLWLPGWVPEPVAAATVANAWPGCRVDRAVPRVLGGPEQVVAGYRLRNGRYHPQSGWLVNDPKGHTQHGRSSADDPNLGAVFAVLGGTDRAAVLQVLARPASGRRLARLRAAATHPVRASRTPGRLGTDAVVWLLLAPLKLVVAVVEFLLLPSRSTARQTVVPVPDAVQREAMRHAAGKLGDGPHIDVAIRVAVATANRYEAVAVARQVADAFAATSRALHPMRLRRPDRATAQRRASRADWLLLTPTELGALAHLPTDPARYGFTTAARHRSAPAGAAQPDPP